jgi:glucosamine--fructose-6-phosphate aminotransferase (isomerizing)
LFREHNLLFAATRKNSLILGVADDGIYLASDQMAFNNSVNKIVYLEDDDKILIKPNSFKIWDKDGQIATRKFHKPDISQENLKEGYAHFMLKEIYQQPKTLRAAIDKYMDKSAFSDLNINWQDITRIKILACGSAYNAGFVAKYWLEEQAQIDVDLEIASEYRYRKTTSSKHEIIIVISQSGETLDTLEALKKAKQNNQSVISIVNAEHSSIARLSDYVLPIMAGAEIGVASTKAFTGQLTVLAALSSHIALKMGRISEEKFTSLRLCLLQLPNLINAVLLSNDIEKIALKVQEFKNILFIGRGAMYPIAIEGALKMKELSYIHAQGYASGELKHGPISLLDENILVIALVPNDYLFEKTLSNLQEIISRKANVLCITSKDCENKIAENIMGKIVLDECDQFTAPILYTLPLQLLAYHTANIKGSDVDQPRNLAKSVTVE